MKKSATLGFPIVLCLALVSSGSLAQGQSLPGEVLSHQRITTTAGGFGGALEHIDRFGVSVCAIGDLDGDEVVDLAVGAVGDDDGGDDVGAVWILFMNTDGTVKSHAKISATTTSFVGTLDPGDGFGTSIAAVGDLSGDGVVDLAVGAPGDDGLGFDAGTVWMLMMNPDGTVWLAHPLTDIGFGGDLDDGDAFGFSVTPLGDLDGNGYDDLAVGALGDDDGDFGNGAVWIVFLESVGFATTEAKISDTAGGFTGTLAQGDGFGSGVAFAPGEGSGSAGLLAVGAFSDNDGSSDRGAVWLLDLQTDGSVVGETKISSTAGGFTGELETGDYFGISVEALGDLDSDGRLDLAVGAFGDDPGGAVWLLFLNDDRSVKSHVEIASGKGGFRDVLDWSDSFGFGLCSLGDLDGDGVGDLAVGARLYDDGSPGVTGAVWTLFLNAATWVDVGNALAGLKGDPILTGFGSLVVGEDMGLMLTNTCPKTTAYLVVGHTALYAPFKGGVFVPDPSLILPMGVGPAGDLTIEGPWSPGVPPDFTLWFQYWIVDAAGPAGFSASNGLAATTP